MGRVDKNRKTDSGMTEKQTGHSIRQRDPGCPNALGCDEFGDIGYGGVPDAEAPPLLFRSLLSVGDSFTWRTWHTRLVSWRAGAGLGTEQTFEHHAFPAKMTQRATCSWVAGSCSGRGPRDARQRERRRHRLRQDPAGNRRRGAGRALTGAVSSRVETDLLPASSWVMAVRARPNAWATSC